MPIRRKLLLLGLTCGFALALAPTAFADTVNLTRFSKAVSGSAAPAGATSVTVNLLRNTANPTGGAAVRNAVDTFTATVTGGAWSGSFVNHAFSTGSDQVEIVYAGVTASETIGGGGGLTPTTNFISFPADTIDGSFGISTNGATLDCFGGPCFSGFTATVNGGAVQTSIGNSMTFSSAVTNADSILITETETTVGATPTTVTLTDAAPLLTPLPSGSTGPFTNSMNQASCAAFLDTNEAVCENLDPGSYTMTQVRGGSTISTQTVTVPAQSTANQPIPSLGSATFAGLQGGDQLKLASSTHVLTTLTVRPFTITSATPLGDLLNGANTTVSGTCSPGEYFNAGSDLCSSTGGVPSPNDLGDSSVSLFSSNQNPIGRTMGQMDDTSSGLTQIDMPELAITSPQNGEAIHTPFQVLGIERYDDPAAVVAAINAGPFSYVGDLPVLASSVGTSPVLFSFGSVGSSALATLGNINVAGGLPLPTLAPGLYADRFTMLDSRGDVSYFDSTFVYQGNATGPSGVSPQGPPAPSCKASATRGLKATIHSVRATDAKKKKKGKKKAAALTVNCTSSTNGARVAVWLQRGNTIVADGSGVVKRGKVKIKLAGTVKKGSYSLVEVIDAGGLATEATHLVTIK